MMVRILISALTLLAEKGKFDAKKIAGAIADLGINPDKINPWTA